MLNANFAVLGAVINLLGCVDYARDTIHGKTNPNRVGWSLWALAPMIAFAAEITEGAQWQQSLMTFSAGFGPLLVLSTSFFTHKVYWKIRPFDWYCAGLSLVALALWLITGKGNIAILFSICADILACLPTATKAFAHPETESASAFAAGVIGAGITVLTISAWTFENYAFPIYLLIANFVITAIIAVRGRQRRKAVIVAPKL